MIFLSENMAHHLHFCWFINQIAVFCSTLPKTFPCTLALPFQKGLSVPLAPAVGQNEVLGILWHRELKGCILKDVWHSSPYFPPEYPTHLWH